MCLKKGRFFNKNRPFSFFNLPRRDFVQTLLQDFAASLAKYDRELAKQSFAPFYLLVSSYCLTSTDSFSKSMKI